jgi:hypothetical protein
MLGGIKLWELKETFASNVHGQVGKTGAHQ